MIIVKRWESQVLENQIKFFCKKRHLLSRDNVEILCLVYQRQNIGINHVIMSILPINYKKRCFNLKEGLDQSTTKIYFIKLYIY